MLAVEPLRGTSNGDDRDGTTTMGSFSSDVDDFADQAFLEDINFNDLFMGIDDGYMLPDLELDPAEIFAEFSAGGEEDSATPSSTAVEAAEGALGVDSVTQDVVALEGKRREEKDMMSHGEEVVSALAKEKPTAMTAEARSASPEGDKGRKSSAAAAAKGSQSQGKRKTKVDWTPELHRRFVQAVEQLGIDKAVPSRILELMGIDCLTRHNIASHLQKYRSHRKHLLAREAEAASWSQRRQMSYAAGAKRPDINPWLAAPTVGFLPPLPPPPPAVQPFRPPLHVWGHPTAAEAQAPAPAVVHMWPPPPHHLALRFAAPAWAPQPPLPPPPDPSYWHHYQRVHMAKGAPCFPQPLPMARFAAPPVPGIVQPPMYRPVHPPMTKHSSSQLLLDAHPSKESIDAAIGDVLVKPWLPLPLGLKPPSLDSVLVELHKQGVSKVP